MAARLRLLVVDDAEEIRVTLKAALTKLGHIAELVESAESALEIFDAGRFDAVIVDLYLPGMNGDQLARLIKRQDGECPIILLTAYPPAQVPEGINEVLIKPFTTAALHASLTRARGNAIAN